MITIRKIQEKELGPGLWNIFHDEVVDAQMPGGCKLEALADDPWLLQTWGSSTKRKARGGHKEDWPIDKPKPVKVCSP